MQPTFGQHPSSYPTQGSQFSGPAFIQNPLPNQPFVGAAYTSAFVGPVGGGRGKAIFRCRTNGWTKEITPAPAVNEQSSKPLPLATRGPPRKPKQSEFSLWVGSLPAGVRIEEVRDYFSRGATADILSVFLMKSNSAFVNYRSREATVAAVQRFDGSRMSGGPLPLKCKVRDPAMERQSTVPTGPAAQTTAIEAIQHNREISARAAQVSKPAQSGSSVPAKYFVMKSLTKEDLDTSVRDGVWATQPHNEEGLNAAFEVRFRRPNRHPILMTLRLRRMSI